MPMLRPRASLPRARASLARRRRRVAPPTGSRRPTPRWSTAPRRNQSAGAGGQGPAGQGADRPRSHRDPRPVSGVSPSATCRWGRAWPWAR
jgi:hypothetical protein